MPTASSQTSQSSPADGPPQKRGMWSFGSAPDASLLRTMPRMPSASMGVSGDGATRKSQIHPSRDAGSANPWPRCRQVQDTPGAPTRRPAASCRRHAFRRCPLRSSVTRMHPAPPRLGLATMPPRGLGAGATGHPRSGREYPRCDAHTTPPRSTPGRASSHSSRAAEPRGSTRGLHRRTPGTAAWAGDAHARRARLAGAGSRRRQARPRVKRD